ncbi:MAG: ribbon-helix-helix protein, CopG family [Hyphomicrobiales bacterium]|nr:ribbon-helix-helix protein, CopG family [Hyphomicrobiales bacterium]
MGKTATLTFRVDASLKEELAKIAKREDRTTSYIAEQAIKDRVAIEQAQIKGIEQAIEQADRGELIPHDEVKAWVESWGTYNELPMPKPKTT